MYFARRRSAVGWNQWVIGGLSLLMAASCGPEAGDEFADLGQSSDPIVNGKKDSGHPAVGKVGDGRDNYCTGTLIGKKTVLTAAHCVDDIDYAFFTLGKRRYYGRTVLHPRWDGRRMAYDVALIRLSKVSSGVKPRAICASPPKRCDPLTIVGFGRSDNGGYGAKRMGHHKIGKVTTNMIHINYLGVNRQFAQTCHGDSGGPALNQSCVGGVVSDGAGCSTTRYVRVDKRAGWIKNSAADSTIKLYKRSSSYAPKCQRNDYCTKSTDCAAGLTCRLDDHHGKICQTYSAPKPAQTNAPDPSSESKPTCASGYRLRCWSGRDAGCACESWL